jgi:hypothetical protein
MAPVLEDGALPQFVIHKSWRRGGRSSILITCLMRFVKSRRGICDLLSAVMLEDSMRLMASAKGKSQMPQAKVWNPGD